MTYMTYAKMSAGLKLNVYLVVSDIYTMPDTSEFTAEFFNDAAVAWRANKIVHGTTFHYKCQAISVSRGRICGKKVYMKPGMIPMNLYCWHHRQVQPYITTDHNS